MSYFYKILSDSKINNELLKLLLSPQQQTSAELVEMLNENCFRLIDITSYRCLPKMYKNSSGEIIPGPSPSPSISDVKIVHSINEFDQKKINQMENPTIAKIIENILLPNETNSVAFETVSKNEQTLYYVNRNHFNLLLDAIFNNDPYIAVPQGVDKDNQRIQPKQSNFKAFVIDLCDKYTTLYNLLLDSKDNAIVRNFHGTMGAILRIINNSDGSIRIYLSEAIDNEIMKIHDQIKNTVDKVTVGQFKNRLLEQFGITQPENSVLLSGFFDFNEDPNISKILKCCIDTEYVLYNPDNYMFLSPTTGNHDTIKYNYMDNLTFPADPNEIFTFNSKQYKLIGIIWHGGNNASGHYVAEINIINPYHDKPPGLYFCNDTATCKIDKWNSDKLVEINLTNPTPHLFIFEKVLEVPRSGGSRHPLTKHNQKNKSKNKTRRIRN